MSMETLQAFGVRVTYVHELGPDAWYIPRLRLLLVEADLSVERRERVADYYIDKVLGDIAEAGAVA